MSRDLVALLSPASRMTGHLLRQFLEEKHVVRDRMKLPSPDACNRLATLIDELWAESLFATSEERRRRLAWLLDETGVMISGFSEELHDERACADARATHDGAAAALDMLVAGTAAVREQAFFQARVPVSVPRTRRTARWHSFVCLLATHILEAIQEANPSEEIGLGDKGPVARFLALVAIPCITRESPRWPTVARYLQRHLPRASNNAGGSVASNISPSNVAH